MIVIILTVRNINYRHIDEIVVIVTVRNYYVVMLCCYVV